MARKINEYGINKIKQLEGLRLVPYLDSAGVPTDGYGNTHDVVMGRAITKEKAEADLRRNLETAEKAVDALVKVPLNDYQFAALVCFVFNVGVGAFRGSTLLRLLNGGNYDAVPSQLMRWNKITVRGKKVANRGLTNRRSAEVGMWSKESFAASRDRSPVKPAGLTHSRTMQGAAVSTVGTIGAALTDASSQVSMVSDYSTALQTIFVILTLAGVGMTIYGRLRIRENDGV